MWSSPLPPCGLLPTLNSSYSVFHLLHPLQPYGLLSVLRKLLRGVPGPQLALAASLEYSSSDICVAHFSSLLSKAFPSHSTPKSQTLSPYLQFFFYALFFLLISVEHTLHLCSLSWLLSVFFTRMWASWGQVILLLCLLLYPRVLKQCWPGSRHSVNFILEAQWVDT